MQSRIIALFVALSFAPSAHAIAQKAQVSPIEKVIEMIGDLEQKTIKEGEACSKTYDEFAEWCEEQNKELGFEIKTGKAEVEELNAVIEKASSDIADEEEKIGGLTATLSTDESDLKAATTIREKENGIFAAEEKELMETVDILSRAVGILERELGGGASLAQMQKTAPGVLDSLKLLVTASKIRTSDASKLTALLQSQQAAASDDHEDDFMLGAPDPAAYESKSGGIVDAIKEMLDDSTAQLATARKTESENKHNYELLKLELEDAIAFANNSWTRQIRKRQKPQRRRL